MLRASLLALLALCALTPIARAQDAAQPEAGVDPWALYDEAYGEAAQGHADQARQLLQRITTHYGELPVGLFAGEALRLLDAQQLHQVAAADPRVRQLQPRELRPPVPVTTPKAAPQTLVELKDTSAPQLKVSPDLGTFLRDEKPTTQARAELVIFQAFHGLALGIEMCIAIDCNDPRPGVLMSILGAGLGVGGSLYFTPEGITPGHTLAVNSGTAWGAWNALAFTFASGAEPSSRAFAGLLAGSQLVGLGLGNGLWTLLHPSAGDVSLVNSGGLWAGALMLMYLGSQPSNDNPRLPWIAMLSATDLGLVAGGLLAREFPMSRGRTFVIDAGGVLGTLLGFGVHVLATGKDNDSMLISGMIGAVAGLGTGAYLSRNWDRDEVPVHVTLAPALDLQGHVSGGQLVAALDL